mmetsp:Transcript_1213/g.3282  ORF Transcript_1213/g.3282 Transcript_1213/m.3282 type:complete len:206 (+) Transcript_1213:386-1003(+)
MRSAGSLRRDTGTPHASRPSTNPASSAKCTSGNGARSHAVRVKTYEKPQPYRAAGCSCSGMHFLKRGSMWWKAMLERSKRYHSESLQRTGLNVPSTSVATSVSFDMNHSKYPGKYKSSSSNCAMTSPRAKLHAMFLFKPKDHAWVLDLACASEAFSGSFRSFTAKNLYTTCGSDCSISWKKVDGADPVSTTTSSLGSYVWCLKHS